MHTASHKPGFASKMLRFQEPGFEEAFMHSKRERPTRHSRNLQIFLAICWIVGICKYAPALVKKEEFGTYLKYVLIVIVQVGMVLLHFYAARQFHKKLNKVNKWAQIEDMQVTYTLLEMVANMVCTILDDNAQRYVAVAFFGPPVMGPTLQSWFPIIDMIRMTAHVNVQLLRMVAFVWMEVDAVMRLCSGGQWPDGLLRMVLGDVCMVLVFGVVLPLVINTALEVRERRNFLARHGKPLSDLGLYWGIASKWEQYFRHRMWWLRQD